MITGAILSTFYPPPLDSVVWSIKKISLQTTQNLKIDFTLLLTLASYSFILRVSTLGITIIIVSLFDGFSYCLHFRFSFGSCSPALTY